VANPDRNLGVSGIHHFTAVAKTPQRNIDFYVGLLGLRLVKLTVNFDDPTTYHLYYGDSVGHPGTIMTFFLGLRHLKVIEGRDRSQPYLF
jgi:catechol 2,3-dioxygenase-like lactoylglutathione lyase family enzyme